MANGRIRGSIGTYPISIDSGTSARTASPTPGPLGTTDGVTEAHSEQLKIELATDTGQLILDITGIIDPTPVSDGTNALISIARGRWTDALISAVSIVPYIGDISKFAKLPRYLNSIRQAIRLARTDAKWATRLREVLVKLKRLLDNLFEVAGDKLPDKLRKYLQQIRDEIDDFLKPGSAGNKSSGATAPAAESSIAKKGGSGPDNKSPNLKKKEGSPSQNGELSPKENSDTMKGPGSGAKSVKERPYSHLEDPPTVGPGKDYTAAQKKKILEENRKRNGGILRDDTTGEELVLPKKSKKGVNPPDNEAQIDHIDAKKPKKPDATSGSNSYKNAKVLSRKNNRAKSND